MNKLLEAAQTLEEISTKALDKVISTGEKLSCRFIAALLEDRGTEAEYIDLSDAIDFAVPENRLDQKFYDSLAASFGRLVNSSKTCVPVITGYFGEVPDGLLKKIKGIASMERGRWNFYGRSAQSSNRETALFYYAR